MSIYKKLIYYILLTALGTSVFVLGVIGYFNKQNAEAAAIELTRQQAKHFAERTRSELHRDIAMVKGLVASVQNVWRETPDLRRKITKDLLHSLLDDNEQLSAIALFWELNAIDTNYIAPYGRMISGFYRGKGKLNYSTQTMDLEGDNLASAYYKMKNDLKPFFLNPKYFRYDKVSMPVYLTTIGLPIISDNEFIGAAEIDIDLRQLQSITLEIPKSKKSYAFILSNNGNAVVHRHDSLQNKSIADLYPNATVQNDLLKKIRTGQSVDFVRYEKDQAYFYVIEPVHINGFSEPWAVGIALPEENIIKEPMRNFLLSLLLGGIGIVVMVLGIIIIVRKFILPMRDIADTLATIAKGKFVYLEGKQKQNPNEIEIIYMAMSTLIDTLRKKMIFAQQMGNQNYSNDFAPASDEDELGHALIELKDNLVVAGKEEIEQREKDERISWASKGYNSYGELTSKHHQNFDNFIKETIVWITKYTKAAIGGLYLVEEKGKAVRLYASHNYTRENKKRRKIPFGEGLVGRCAQENETLYLSDVPKNFLKISSGMGEEKASYILLVPLRLNQQAFGVIELASFEPIEQYRIDFVEQIGENIAATVVNIQANTQTAELLTQQKRLADDMQTKEQRLRSEMETMEKEYSVFKEEYELFKHTNDAYFRNLAAIELDMKGNMFRCNDRCELLLGYTTDEVAEATIQLFAPKSAPFDVKGFMNHILAKRGLKRELTFVSKMGVEKSLMTYWSIIKHNTKAWVMVQMFDITEYRMIDLEHNRVVNNLKKEIEKLKNAQNIDPV